MARPHYDPRRYEYYVYISPSSVHHHIATCPNFPGVVASGADRNEALRALGKELDAVMMHRILNSPHSIPTAVVKGGTYRLWRPTHDTALRLFTAEVFVGLHYGHRKKRWEKDVVRRLANRHTPEEISTYLLKWSDLSYHLPLDVNLDMLRCAGYEFSVVDTHA